jgi:hypothetical protein
LKENGIKPYFKTYRDTLSNFDKPAFNIVGYIEGTDKKLKNEFVIIGAHYDHIGNVAKCRKWRCILETEQTTTQPEPQR